MTNQTQPKIDPALYEHLQELAEMARETGATEISILRIAPDPDTGIAISTVLVIKYPLSDGQTTKVELL